MIKLSQTDYKKLYNKIFKTLKNLTPLKADCGQLCSGACCKGDSTTGMRLFPHEESSLPVITTDNGIRLVVCTGACNRDERPLACRIFPFFPTVDDKNRVYVELDYRGYNLCPMIEHFDEIMFDKRFLRAIKKVGKILVKDEKCRKFLQESTKEIDTYHSFLFKE